MKSRHFFARSTTTHRKKEPARALRKKAMMAIQPPAKEMLMALEEKKLPSERLATLEPPRAVSTHSHSPRCMYSSV